MISFSKIAVTGFSILSAFFENSLATATSSGKIMKLRKPLNPTFRSASLKICSIISFWPSSIRLFPTSTFKYFKKVLAIAPATIILSARSINFSINGNLSDIFAPPITATNGLSGFLKACKIVEYSFSSNKPAMLGIFLAISLVEVCPR